MLLGTLYSEPREKPSGVRSWAIVPHSGEDKGTWAATSPCYQLPHHRSTLIPASRVALVTSESRKIHIFIFNILFLHLGKDVVPFVCE